MKKVFVISDMHGKLDGLDASGYDIAAIAGDFAKMTGWGKWHLYDMKKWIQKKFIPWTQKTPDTEFVVVPGNHDLIFDKSKIEMFQDISYSIDWPENVHILSDRFIELNGLKIYGTPWVPIINGKWAFEADHDMLQQKFSNIPDNLDILITHSPPRFKYLDFSRQTYLGPFGSSELTQAIYKKQPRFVFCGHIHSGDHALNFIDTTKVYNVARVDESYEIAYEPVTIEA